MPDHIGGVQRLVLGAEGVAVVVVVRKEYNGHFF